MSGVLCGEAKLDKNHIGIRIQHEADDNQQERLQLGHMIDQIVERRAATGLCCHGKHVTTYNHVKQGKGAT